MGKSFKKTIAKLSMFVVLALVLLPFQNCGNGNFSTNSEIDMDSTYVPTISTDQAPLSAIAQNELCGPPNLNPSTDQGIFLYIDCATETIYLTQLAGGSSSALTFSGSLTSEKGISSIVKDNFESNDSLTQTWNSFAFTNKVSTTYYDGINFKSNAIAQMTLALDSTSNQRIFVGASKKRVYSPYKFYSNGTGPVVTDGTLCGSPNLNLNQEKGVYLWKDCSTNEFVLQFLSGGVSGTTVISGEIANETGLFTARTPELWESNDQSWTTADNKFLRFTANVTSGGQDRLKFKVNNISELSITIDNSYPLFFGADKQAMDSPAQFNAQGDFSGENSSGGGIGGGGGGSGTGTMQTVTPAALGTNVSLRNPGRGFEQAGKIQNSGAFSYNNNVENYTDITYIRLPWVVVEPTNNNYTWKSLNDAINNSVSRGKQAAISIISWRPIKNTGNYQEAMPSWYYNNSRHKKCTDINVPAGCTFYRVSFSGKECSNAGNECANRWAFNHDDPIFIQQQVELIEALRAQYDNPQWAAKIAYIDVRSIGSWSESHTTNVYVDNRNYRWPMPKWSNYKQILDAHLKFQHIPQIVNFDNDEAVSMQETNGNHPWDYTCKQAMSTGKTVGWRTDGIESTYLEIAEVMGWSSAARDCWKVGPIYAEAMSGDGLVDDSKTSVNEITQGMERLTEWHASGFNNKYSNAYPQDSFFTTTVNNWLLKAGYRLQIANASIPNIVQANTNVQVNVNLKNTGTAPFFRSFYSLKMRFVPVGGGNSVIINLPGSLKNVVPGAGNSTFSGTGQLAKGTYDVYVGIVQDPTFTTSFPVKLAQQSSLCSKVGNDWWCKIGQSQAQ